MFESFTTAVPIVWDARAFLNQPKLLHVMPANGSISGITVLGNEFFVVQGKTWRGVDVYDTKTFTFQRFLPIPKSQRLESIVACQGNLYVSYRGYNQVLLYDYAKNTYLLPLYTVSDDQSEDHCKLSKSRSDNILVTSFPDYSPKTKIRERDKNGGLIKEFKFDCGMELEDCIQLSDRYILVIARQNQQRALHIVDSINRITHSYCGVQGSDCTPFFMTIDTMANVLITDIKHNRIEILSPTLAHLGYIEVPGYKPNQPSVLHLDEVNRRLYIGEAAGGRLFVLEADV